MSKLKVVIVAASLLVFVTGCDIPWRGVARVLSGGEITTNNDQTWWDENDQHLEWMIWPVSEWL